jgi:chromosomal replication initiation ATPase DnaA
MFDLINEKWDEILEILKKEHDIMDVSFNTWIKPLKIHSVEDNIITLLIPDDNIGISYLNKKYYVPLKVVIHEVTGHAFDIVFSHESDLNKEIERLIEKIDPFNTQLFTFNDCVVLFGNEFVEDGKVLDKVAMMDMNNNNNENDNNNVD